MKRGTPEHTKVRHLMRALDVRKYAAVGILELLWHLAAKECPDGGIGKLENEDIAESLDWWDDPDVLIGALVKTRWLDEHPVHRLVIHDWADHREDAVDTLLARSGRRYADGSAPKMNRLTKQERSALNAKYASAQESAPEAHDERTGSAPEAPCLSHSHSPATAGPGPSLDRGPEPRLATAIAGPEPKPSAGEVFRQPNGAAASARARSAASPAPANSPPRKPPQPHSVLDDPEVQKALASFEREHSME